MKTALQKLIAHLQWADGQVLARCRDAHAEVEVAHLTEAVRLYAHILGAERVWYLRLQKEDWRVQKVWPTMGLDACEAMAKQNAADFSAYVHSLTEADIATLIPYTNTEGQSFSSTVGDIVMHVALHGVHHRGQIATTLRRVGIEPPSLDYIRFARGK